MARLYGVCVSWAAKEARRSVPQRSQCVTLVARRGAARHVVACELCCKFSPLSCVEGPSLESARRALRPVPFIRLPPLLSSARS